MDDYYDGPLSGFFRCAVCSSCYQYRALAWDDQHDARIYELRPVPPEAFANLQRVLAPFVKKYGTWGRIPCRGSAETRELDLEYQAASASAAAPVAMIASTDVDHSIMGFKWVKDGDVEMALKLEEAAAKTSKPDYESFEWWKSRLGLRD